jgi:uncharacterized membrane protein YedE/YeeE
MWLSPLVSAAPDAAAFWPWWWSAAALAGVALGFWLFERRTFGVSGSMATVIGAADADRRAADADRAALAEGGDDVEAAMLAATVAAFGEEAVQEAASHAGAAEAATGAPRGAAPWTAHLTFLVCACIGGAIATATTTGSWEPRLFHATHRELFGGGIAAFAVLLGGGMLTGFGTRMAGGCTSGHGLIGCARMQPGSLVTTATFFGTAIGISMALHYWIIG